jgi:hypothetical protein
LIRGGSTRAGEEPLPLKFHSCGFLALLPNHGERMIPAVDREAIQEEVIHHEEYSTI